MIQRTVVGSYQGIRIGSDVSSPYNHYNTVCPTPAGDGELMLMNLLYACADLNGPCERCRKWKRCDEFATQPFSDPWIAKHRQDYEALKEAFQERVGMNLV